MKEIMIIEYFYGKPYMLNCVLASFSIDLFLSLNSTFSCSSTEVKCCGQDYMIILKGAGNYESMLKQYFILMFGLCQNGQIILFIFKILSTLDIGMNLKWTCFYFTKCNHILIVLFLSFFFSLFTADVQVTKEEHHKVQMDLDNCLTELGDM